MESIEVSGKTVEEAIQRALEQLGLTREQVEITILKKAKSGILWLGAGEAKVKVTPLPLQTSPEASDKGTAADEITPEATGKRAEMTKAATEILEKLLSEMKIAAQVEIKQTAIEEESPRGIVLEITQIEGDDMGTLIGRRGQTLASLQHILRLILAHRFKTRVPLTIDVEGYKQRHYTALRRLALQSADKVKTSGQPVTLEPMPANERRIIHLTLANNPDVGTESIGDNEIRKVVIMPKKREDTQTATKKESL